MASKANNLKKKYGVVVRICNHPNQEWHGFTLQKNHLFGQDDEGYFVLKFTESTTGNIYVYRECAIYEGQNMIDRKWITQAVSRNSVTGRAIIKKIQEVKISDALESIETGKPMRSRKIEYQSAASQVGTFYNPRLMAGCNYTPMHNMRIPGGAYPTKAKTLAIRVSK